MALDRGEIPVVFLAGAGITERESCWQTLETEEGCPGNLAGLTRRLLLGGWELVYRLCVCVCVCVCGGGGVCVCVCVCVCSYSMRKEYTCIIHVHVHVHVCTPNIFL